MTRYWALTGLGFAALTFQPIAGADIIGLVPGTYSYNHPYDSGVPLVGSDYLQITNGVNQLRSMVFYQPQSVAQFTASFTYRATSIAACPVAQGVTFFIENDSRGTGAVGGHLGGLGYDGITPSANIALALDTGPSLMYSGYSTGGIISGLASTSPVNAFSGHNINVTLTYANPLLTLTMVDTVTNATYAPPSFLVGDIAASVGGASAYIGVSASTGNGVGSGGATQELSNFRYTTPEPASVLGLLAALGFMRRLAR